MSTIPQLAAYQALIVLSPTLYVADVGGDRRQNEGDHPDHYPPIHPLRGQTGPHEYREQ